METFAFCRERFFVAIDLRDDPLVAAALDLEPDRSPHRLHVLAPAKPQSAPSGFRHTGSVQMFLCQLDQVRGLFVLTGQDGLTLSVLLQCNRLLKTGDAGSAARLATYGYRGFFWCSVPKRQQCCGERRGNHCQYHFHFSLQFQRLPAIS